MPDLPLRALVPCVPRWPAVVLVLVLVLGLGLGLDGQRIDRLRLSDLPR